MLSPVSCLNFFVTYVLLFPMNPATSSVDINGFEYEIREASRCVKLGRTGSDRYTPQDSLALTRLMYDTRMSWGMKFAGEV